MNRAPIVMYAVAAIAGSGGAFVLTRRASDEGAIYARRIAGVMLCALTLILTVYATALSFFFTQS